ncbi:lanthionine synthetase LanC family protein [Lacinutrix jangbogonensis]|uniref:lanthionine synthetase LanC family protein n=1 Tax=Lacinutrix jangbogonensis TaxID=1469557 RepID=UPI00053ECB54|nr:lanthionine synthetase LanC family protein [Lacinutrix jangbogonensis]
METLQIDSTKETLLNAALEIGDHLISTAIWDSTSTYCTWNGARDIQDAQIAKYSKRVSILSPEFYSGTGGVAYFLIELYHNTQNEEYKKIALGAWMRSINYMRINDFPASSISFYAGDLGLIFVGYRFLEVDNSLGEAIQPHLDWLISNLKNGLNDKHSLDIIGGNAGAIPVLLELKRKYNLDIFEKVATDCTEELISLAQWKDDMCIWSSHKVHGVELDTPPTTGYSHGASGLAVALLEAYQYFGDNKYLKHGRGSFTFENSLFNDEEGNWVDTRYPHVKRNGKITGTFRSAWCHGAPGIALANLRAAFLDTGNSELYFEKARIAINTTKTLLLEKIESLPEKDATLCHGILGLSDIIFSYAQKLNNEELMSFSRAITLDYISKFKNVISLPSGIVAGGYNPSIMVGLSGIGLHCLRLYSNENISSPLICVL